VAKVSGAKQDLPEQGVKTVCNMAANTKDPITLDSMYTMLKEEIRNVKSGFDTKIETMQATITTSIVDEVSKRISEEMKTTVDKIVSERLGEMRAEIDSDMEQLKGKINEIQERTSYATAAKAKEELSLNIIVKNMPHAVNENVVTMVNCLIKDGLQLAHVTIEKAERKESRGEHPGIIIAKCRSKEDKDKITKGKRKLKDSTIYKNVYVEHDKPLEQRIQEANLRTIAKVLGKDKLIVKGSRICIKQDQAVVNNAGRR
jgi:hypothetical protein